MYCGAGGGDGGDTQIILHISGYSSRWEIGNMEQLIHDNDDTRLSSEFQNTQWIM